MVGTVEGVQATDNAVRQAVGVKVIQTAIETQEDLVSSLLEGLGGNLDRTA